MPLPIGRRVMSAIALCAVALLAGCATTGSVPVFYGPQEKFGSVATYSRLFDATLRRRAKPSRRALLSQGYLINTTTAEMVEGKKSFQPSPETHLQMVIRVVCVPDSPSGQSQPRVCDCLAGQLCPVQDQQLRQPGRGALGSVSLPIAASSDSLVKVGAKPSPPMFSTTASLT